MWMACYTNVDTMTQLANINTPVTPAGARPLPTWGRILNLQSGGEHEYRAMFVRLEKRFANRHQYLLSYTLAEAAELRRGNAAGHHRLLQPGSSTGGPGAAIGATPSWRAARCLFPFDINVGAVWTLRSSMPFSARAGRDLNNDGAANTDYVPGHDAQHRQPRHRGHAHRGQRVAGAERARTDRRGEPRHERLQPLRRPRQQGDRRSADRRLEFIAQVFNLFGRDNLGAIEQGWQENALSDSFGRILTVQPRQQAELAVRFMF